MNMFNAIIVMMNGAAVGLVIKGVISHNNKLIMAGIPLFVVSMLLHSSSLLVYKKFEEVCKELKKIFKTLEKDEK